MIVEHSVLAIDLADLLDISKKEFDTDENCVIFRFKPYVQYVLNPVTDEYELQTIYPTTRQSFVFSEAMDSAYDWWVNEWQSCRL